MPRGFVGVLSVDFVVVVVEVEGVSVVSFGVVIMAVGACSGGRV